MSRLERIPHREFQSKTVSIIGLGCSSFSTLFLDDDDPDRPLLRDDMLRKDHPRVAEWIRTIHYAVNEAGVTLLDTAPWYGHGVSERVLGWALSDLGLTERQRRNLQVQTKVGRYAADPRAQFDFSYDATVKSIQRSLERLHCGYIDCVQLHDPEFAPSLPQLMATLEALRFARRQGWCRSIGLTGYPLEVQHQIMEASRRRFGTNLFDRALTYCHYNLHDTSLVSRPLPGLDASFLDYCHEQGTTVLAAAPLSMGLLTAQGPPAWHPAGPELRAACRAAARRCADRGVDLAELALLFALALPDVPCTVLGMKSVAEVRRAQAVAHRLADLDMEPPLPAEQVLDRVLTPQEKECLWELRDPEHGPFAEVWRKGVYKWDGVQEAIKFWSRIENALNHVWHVRDNEHQLDIHNAA